MLGKTVRAKLSFPSFSSVWFVLEAVTSVWSCVVYCFWWLTTEIVKYYLTISMYLWFELRSALGFFLEKAYEVILSI